MTRDARTHCEHDNGVVLSHSSDQDGLGSRYFVAELYADKLSEITVSGIIGRTTRLPAQRAGIKRKGVVKMGQNNTLSGLQS